MTNFGNQNVIYTGDSYSNIGFKDLIINNISNKDNTYSFANGTAYVGSNGLIYEGGGIAIGGYGNDTYIVDNYDVAGIYDGSNSSNDTLQINDYISNILYVVAVDNKHIGISSIYGGSTFIYHGLTDDGLIENLKFYDYTLTNLNTSTTAAFINTYSYLWTTYWQQLKDLGLTSSPPIASPTIWDLYNAGLINNTNGVSAFNSNYEAYNFIYNELPNLVTIETGGNESYEYLASYPELIAPLNGDPSLASKHYFQYGINEGKVKDNFDEWRYVASNTDLINAFKNLGVSQGYYGIQHYVQAGYAEGRSIDSFDVWNYMASNTDLISYFANDGYADDILSATKHYVQAGYAEGRSIDSFDEWRYLASNTDLITAFGSNTSSSTKHFVELGFGEGRSIDSFDKWSYLASNKDLINFFGTYIGSYQNSWGTMLEKISYITQHYVQSGFSEGRQTDNFDEWGYLASNVDLIDAFGSNIDVGIKHFISDGYSEGRITDGFNAANYLEKYVDLQSAFGTDTTLAKIHFVQSGYSEGRSDI